MNYSYSSCPFIRSHKDGGFSFFHLSLTNSTYSNPNSRTLKVSSRALSSLGTICLSLNICNNSAKGTSLYSQEDNPQYFCPLTVRGYPQKGHLVRTLDPHLGQLSYGTFCQSGNVLENPQPKHTKAFRLCIQGILPQKEVRYGCHS